MSNPIRILFVDDEPMLLGGLKRMLHSKRNVWNMRFAASGQEALAMLETEHADVVISDMRMPGMNGCELLEKVRERCPEAVRIILSGFSEDSLITQSILVAHRYLSKPCETEELTRVITRAQITRDLFREERIRVLASRSNSLPSLPDIYTKMVQLLSTGECSAQDIAELIQQDIAMSAKILHIANSAFFASARQITSVSEAVELLGFDVIRSLVLSLHIFEALHTVPSSYLNPADLWRHSLKTGTVAKHIAQELGLDRQHCDYAFVGGLLHDVGALLIATHAPDRCQAIADYMAHHKVSNYEAERAILGFDHAEAGGYLLSLWNLPDPIVEAVTFHHSPARLGNPIADPLTLIHIIDALDRAHKSGQGRPSDHWDKDHVAKLNLTEQQLRVWSQLISHENETALRR